MQQKDELLTVAGVKQLEARLAELVEKLDRVRRSKGDAALDGNIWHDNFAFEDLERQERALLHQIGFIRERLSRAVVIEAEDDAGKVCIGSVVDVQFADGRASTFVIASEPESNPRAGIISYRAPLAQAILGAAAGDERTYSVGDRIHTVKVLSVRGSP